MTSPDSPEYRRYLNRISMARICLVVAFAVCGIGYALCCSYVHEHTYRSGFYGGPSICVRAIPICGFCAIACLLAVAGFVGESVLRLWARRPLTRWELVAVLPVGLLTCLAPFVAIGLGQILYGSFAWDSLVGMLAVGIAACLIFLIVATVYALVCDHRSRQSAINLRATTGLLGVATCIMLAVFVPLRTIEGQRQREIVTALAGMGYHVHYDYEIRDEGRTGHGKDQDEPSWPASMIGVDFCHRVVRVDLDGDDPDVVAILPYLQSLRKLKFVVLWTGVPAEKINQIKDVLPTCKVKIRSKGEWW